MPKPELSIIIPCYNESENIPLLLKRFSEIVGHTKAELILVNNGSLDNSQQVLEGELKKQEYSFARTVIVPKNVGYGHGIMSGLRHARADVVAYTHADLQCDPLDVIRAYNIFSKEENKEGCLIKGWRIRRKLSAKIVSNSFQMVATLLFLQKYSEINAQPKVFHRNFIEQLRYPPKDTNFDLYLLYKAKQRKMKITSIKVDFPERKYGKSKVFSNFSALIKTYGTCIKYMLELRFLGERKAQKSLGWATAENQLTS